MSFVLPMLSDEEVTDLTSQGYKGVKVYWRPMDVYDKSKWADKCRQCKVDIFSIEAKALCVTQQVTKVEGLEIKDKEGKERSFNKETDLHLLPLAIMVAVEREIGTWSVLSEGTEKNLERPSVLPEVTGTAT